MEQEIIRLHKFIGDYDELKVEIEKLGEAFQNIDNTSHYVSILNELNAICLSGISASHKVVFEHKDKRHKVVATKKGLRVVYNYETHSRELDWTDYVELIQNEAKITAWFKKEYPKKLQRWLDFKNAFSPFMSVLFEFGLSKTSDYLEDDVIKERRKIFEQSVGSDLKILVPSGAFHKDDDDYDEDKVGYEIANVRVESVGVRFRIPSDEPSVYALMKEERPFLEKANEKFDCRLFGKDDYVFSFGDGRGYDDVDKLEAYGYSELFPKLRECVAQAKSHIEEKIVPITRAEADMRKKLSKYTALKVI